MEIKGIIFAGSATTDRDATTAFFRKVFGLEPKPLEGFPADLFEFPDGSSFGVVGMQDPAHATRTIGFEVSDLDAAVTELKGHGIEVDEPAANQLGRYVHMTAPDGKLYELVEKPQS